MSAQVAADLRAAADVLERDGWTQGTYADPDGCKCLYGALHFIATDGRSTSDADLMTPEEVDRSDAAEWAVMATLGAQSWYDVLQFNDAPGRTAAEVVTALRAAADRAEAEA